MTKLSLVRAEVDKIADNLGMPIDSGIKDAVVALRFLDFPTSGSCEGHKDSGFYYPWVEVYEDEPEGITDRHKLTLAWEQANAPFRKQMTELLSKYYKNKSVEEEYRLKMVNMGIYGGFRIQSNPELDNGKGYDKKRQQLFRNEMNDFARYLLS